MRTAIALVAAAVSLTWSLSEARAEGKQTGLEIAARTGLLLPMGAATNGANDRLGNTFATQLPIAFDAGWRATPSLFVGGYFGAAVGGPGGSSDDECEDSGADCIGRSTRLGVQAQWHFSPQEPTHAWVGYGFGYEWASLHMYGDKGTKSVAFRGPEYGHVLLGVDFDSNQSLHLGLFADVSFGQYSRMEWRSWSSPTKSMDIEERAAHEWVMIGVRATLMP